MPKKKESKFAEVGFEEIVSPKHVIHPCLDWVNGELIVGVNLRKKNNGVLASTRGLVVDLASFGPVCAQGQKFQGAVGEGVARKHVQFLETAPDSRRPIVGADLLTNIACHLDRFVVFPQPWWSWVLSSWILGTYVFPLFSAYPYLRITSPEPACGKSLLGSIIANVGFQGEFMTSPTEAQLFHLPEESRGVQVWDEVEVEQEADKKRFSLIQPVLLNGYRNGGVVPRQVGKGYQESAKFHVFCPRVFIGLSKLPEPARQRCISVDLEKRQLTLRRPAQYLGWKETEAEREIKSNCLLWALQTVQVVQTFYQHEDLRTKVENIVGPGRPCDDIWLPLFSVASAAMGGIKEALECLSEPAQEITKAGTTVTTSTQPGSKPYVGQAKESSRIQQAALDVMQEQACPMTPSALAKKVSKRLGMEVSHQTVSKSLKKIGIASQKKRGRRVFLPKNDELRDAWTKLGHRWEGQQGQEGHQVEG
jgi:transposase